MLRWWLLDSTSRVYQSHTRRLVTESFRFGLRVSMIRLFWIHSEDAVFIARVPCPEMHRTTASLRWASVILLR